ncbi:MAG: phosphoribosylanthranilate isomerase [Myxococcales bacterium]|nr:phosphoribosylanthranilate isomerase [Myxococcales bacterium]
MWVKICGVTTVADAVACVEAGADAIGFNFWPHSKRYRPLAALADVARAAAGKVERIGVFVDPTAEDVEAAFAAEVIDTAQLHGDEEGALCARLAGRYLKAVRLGGEFSFAGFDRHVCARFLVDAPFAGYGGSGTLIDEDLARRAVLHLAGRARVILAGGLTPDNVAALGERVKPFGVDVATGVERAPGVKDHDLVRRFVAAAKGRAA